jgi:hypothetical protein
MPSTGAWRAWRADVDRFGPGVTRQPGVRPYMRQRADPLVRPLKVYTLDPSSSRVDGSVATVDVPWEPLAPGPVGALLAVDAAGSDVSRGVDLDDPRLLIQGGLDPSVSDHRFHQQMVYAVCSRIYAQFQNALGRVISWGFDPGPSHGRLTLRPHAGSQGSNAQYDPDTGAISFGFFKAPAEGAGRSAPNGRVFTCLSHDVIAHEFTHALLDGLRSHFTVPTSSDVLGFHEGFADLVAVLQHFTHKDVLESQIKRTGGRLERAELLTNIARQFAEATGGTGGIRCAVQPEKCYSPDAEAHEMGSVLVSEVFAAFTSIFQRKTERYVALAGWQPPRPMPHELVLMLASEAARLADQFLSLCIRAVDYCPPVDLTLGEYLRAMITADRELVPDDPWNYRDSLIAAFAERAIYPGGVDQLSEDSLCWRPPTCFVEPIAPLHFSNLRFAGDPSWPAGSHELYRQADALWDFVTRAHVASEFGLSAPGSDGTDAPVVQSIRTARRVGPDGQVLFDLVAEVTQRRRVVDPASGRGAKFFGGSTLIIGPEGEVRYVIRKHINSDDRLARQLEYQRTSGYWASTNGQLTMKGYAHRLAHQHPR